MLEGGRTGWDAYKRKGSFCVYELDRYEMKSAAPDLAGRFS